MDVILVLSLIGFISFICVYGISENKEIKIYISICIIISLLSYLTLQVTKIDMQIINSTQIHIANTDIIIKANNPIRFKEIKIIRKYGLGMFDSYEYEIVN